MKRGWIICLIMGIITIAAITAVPVFAAGPSSQGKTSSVAIADTSQSAMTDRAEGGSGYANGFSNMCNQPILTQLAQALNLTEDQLVAELDSGKTLSQIATEQNVSEEALVDIILAHCWDCGYMTTEQTDTYLQQERACAQTLLTQDLFSLTGNNGYPMMGLHEYCYGMKGGWQYFQGSGSMMSNYCWDYTGGNWSGGAVDNDIIDAEPAQQNYGGTVHGRNNMTRDTSRMGCW